jgi:hypothetical protein
MEEWFCISPVGDPRGLIDCGGEIKLSWVCFERGQRFHFFLLFCGMTAREWPNCDYVTWRHVSYCPIGHVRGSISVNKSELFNKNMLAIGRGRLGCFGWASSSVSVYRVNMWSSETKQQMEQHTYLLQHLAGSRTKQQGASCIRDSGRADIGRASCIRDSGRADIGRAEQTIDRQLCSNIQRR